MADTTRCRSCAVPIAFRRTPSGRLEPISLQTGESHFIDCPERREWRKAERPLTQTELFPDDEAPLPPPDRRRAWEA